MRSSLDEDNNYRGQEEIGNESELKTALMKEPLLVSESGDSGVGSGGCSTRPKDFVVDLSFVNLGLKLKSNNRPVLQGVTGTIYHGRVTAVMGPSGAGIIEH